MSHDIITLLRDAVSAASWQRMTDSGAFNAFCQVSSWGISCDSLQLHCVPLWVSASSWQLHFCLHCRCRWGTWSAWLLKIPVIKQNKVRELFSVPPSVLHGCFCLFISLLNLSKYYCDLAYLDVSQPSVILRPRDTLQNQCGGGLWVVCFNCSVCGVGTQTAVLRVTQNHRMLLLDRRCGYECVLLEIS